jgi:hypothetical protein
MTKFPKVGNIGLSGLENQSIWFWQILNKIKEEAKFEALKIQECLKDGKGKERYQGVNPYVNDQIWHSEKIRVPYLSNQNIWFLQC